MELQKLPEPGCPPEPAGAPLPVAVVDEWFANQVLPLEPALTRLLRRHWRHGEDIPDLRQEIYMRVYESALANGMPRDTMAFVFTSARNLMADHARRARVVSFETVATLEDLPEQPEADFTPEQLVDARQKLNLLQLALDDLPPRCREIIMLRKIEGLSHKEIAKRLGIVEGTIERQITLGVRAIAKLMFEQGAYAAVAWTRRQRQEEPDA